MKRRPLISSMVQLHFNPGKWWTWFADAFAVCLIIITVSGIVMIKGPKGLWGRGGIELVAYLDSYSFPGVFLIANEK